MTKSILQTLIIMNKIPWVCPRKLWKWH